MRLRNCIGAHDVRLAVRDHDCNVLHVLAVTSAPFALRIEHVETHASQCQLRVGSLEGSVLKFRHCLDDVSFWRITTKNMYQPLKYMYGNACWNTEYPVLVHVHILQCRRMQESYVSRKNEIVAEFPYLMTDTWAASSLTCVALMMSIMKLK